MFMEKNRGMLKFEKRNKTLLRAAAGLTAACVLLFSLFLFGCVRVIRDASDELTLNVWGKTLDGGVAVSLHFEDDNAVFSVVTDDGKERTLSGLCVLDTEEFVILDEETENNYPFSYVVHGDSLELTYGGSTLLLDKITETS